MAPVLKRKGIAISNRPPAKRRKSIQKRNRSSTTRSDQPLPPEFQDGEWPLKRILKEQKGYYLVDWADHPYTGETYEPTWEHKSNVGTAAKEEWEAEKRQKESYSSESVVSHQKHTDSHTREDLRRRAIQQKSKAITQEVEETPRVPGRRYLKRRYISSSSPSPEIPETQREVVSKPDSFAVEIYRPVEFHSQDYSTLASSHAESAVGTQYAGTSKDIVEGDSTLGSSIPPDSPIEISASSSLNQEPSSQVLPSYPAADSESKKNSARSVSVDKQNVSSGVDLPGAKHSSQANQPNLLVIRSDSPGERGTVPSHPVEVSDEQAKSSVPWSPLFVGEEDLELQPISDPNRLEEAIETEGEFDILPSVNSSLASGHQDGIRRRVSHSHPDSAVSSSAVKSPGGKSPRNRELKTTHRELRQEEAPRSLTTPIRSLRGTPSRFAHNNSTESPISNQSQPLYTQISVANAPTTKSKSLPPILRVQTPRNSTVTVSRHSRASAAPSSPLAVRTALFATQSFGRLSQPHHTSSHNSVSPQVPVVGLTSYNMPNSQRESSPRVRKPPSATSEMTPQSDLREKLRQIRATSRANQNARLKDRTNSGNSTSPVTKGLETRFSRRLSPEKNVEPPVNVSTLAHDQPIPSLESVDGTAGEMEVDKEDNEHALTSSLAPPPSILNAVLEKTDMPTQDHEVERNISELDIPTMPLLQPCEFVVPLPIDGRIKHQYIAALREKWKDITDFLHFPKSQRLIDSMTDMIQQLNNTVVHTDLGLDGPATQVAPTTEEVEWAEAASSKFAFLGKIIHILWGSENHIVIAVRRGPTMDLLRTYLRGKGVQYREYSNGLFDGRIDGSVRDRQMVYTLLPTDSDAMKHVPKSASLIMAFDDSFEAATLPEWCTTSRFVPVLLLLVVNSAEHVGKCIPPDFLEPERLRRLTKAVVHVYKDVGEMPFHLDLRHAYTLDPGARLALVKKDLGAKIAHAAAQTAEALLSENFALNFNLQPISELDLAGLEDQPPSTEESKEVSSSASRAGTPGGHKRLRDERSSSAIQSKRQRLTPLGDITHISDSIKTSQPQLLDELKILLKKSHQDLSDERKSRLKAEDQTTYLAARLREIESSLGSLQTRYETRTKQVHSLQRETKRLHTDAEIEAQRLQKLQSENLALKDTRLQLQEDLRLARSALESNSVPEIAELAQSQSAQRKASEEAAAALKANESLRKDFEFTRSAYQDASTKAAEYAAQVSDLESQNIELKRKASDERRRLTELNYKQDRKRDLDRIQGLEVELRRLEGVVGRVEEENRVLRNGKGGRSGGVVTRAGSVQPANIGVGAGGNGGAGSRSPRPGTAGPAGGVGSRGASPAPGNLNLGLGGQAGHAHGPVGGRASALRHER